MQITNCIMCSNNELNRIAYSTRNSIFCLKEIITFTTSNQYTLLTVSNEWVLINTDKFVTRDTIFFLQSIVNFFYQVYEELLFCKMWDSYSSILLFQSGLQTNNNNNNNNNAIKQIKKTLTKFLLPLWQ